jgi:methionyl-tRNA formyltransferase
VAPPYPGAFTELAEKKLGIFRTELIAHQNWRPPGLYVTDSRCFAACGDHGTLELLEMQYEGRPFVAQDFLSRFGTGFIPLK